MIRRVQFNISYANPGKLAKLDSIFDEAVRVINLYIDRLWQLRRFSGSYVDFKVDTWLSARMQQALGKQALEIVKSQRRRRRKTKPVFKRTALNLDSRFLDIRFDDNTFDVWFKLSSIGNRLSLKLPSKQHKHWHTLLRAGFTVKRSFRLRKTDSGYFIDLYVEKESPPQRAEGRDIAVDCGYKKLICTSDGEIIDEGLEQCYEKISRKKQGSKGFKRALRERDNLINRSCKRLQLSDVRRLFAENLKNVKRNSKGRIRKSFNNKLQRWSYPKVLGKLSSLCEEFGIQFILVNPAYTSQTCSLCGHVDRNSRQGEQFRCTCCKFVLDADINAARNILHRGAYSPSAVPT
ncbi:MAG: transposase [Pirellulaceae bacterium]|nr:MAG: transposase [Pirellulaceae bacterium]